jgi:hypothetical protein
MRPKLAGPAPSFDAAACNQAAMEEARAGQILALAAQYTPAMSLDGHIKGSALGGR